MDGNGKVEVYGFDSPATPVKITPLGRLNKEPKDGQSVYLDKNGSCVINEGKDEPECEYPLRKIIDLEENGSSRRIVVVGPAQKHKDDIAEKNLHSVRFGLIAFVVMLAVYLLSNIVHQWLFIIILWIIVDLVALFAVWKLSSSLSKELRKPVLSTAIGMSVGMTVTLVVMVLPVPLSTAATAITASFQFLFFASSAVSLGGLYFIVSLIRNRKARKAHSSQDFGTDDYIIVAFGSFLPAVVSIGLVLLWFSKGTLWEFLLSVLFAK